MKTGRHLYWRTDDELKKLIGKRVLLIEMKDDPNPVPSKTKGTVYHTGGGVINVKWDNGQNLGLIDGIDKYVVIV